MMDHDLTPEQRTELGDLRPLLEHLKSHDAPEPNSVRLLAALAPFLADDQHPENAPVFEEPQRDFRDWLHLAWAQTTFLDAPFWIASLLLMALGMLLGLSMGGSALTVCLVVISPPLAVMGIAYIFRPATRVLWELEQLSRIQPLEFLYARLALILTLNLSFALALLLVAWTQGLQIVLWRLLLIWLGPMVGLTGLALFCSVRWNTFIGILAPMAVWCVVVFAGWRDVILNTPPHLASHAAFMLRLTTSNVLVSMALVATLMGVWLMLESGRWIAKWR